MYWSSKVLGSGVAQKLQEKGTIPVLQIGSDAFTRGDLAGLECFNFTAAINLTNILKGLPFRNTKDLYERCSPASLALPRLGYISLAVLGAAFESKGLGGNAPLENWLKKHRDGELVTFGSVKHQVAREQEQAKADAKSRKDSRTRKAHELRVMRFTERKQA